MSHAKDQPSIRATFGRIVMTVHEGRYMPEIRKEDNSRVPLTDAWRLLTTTKMTPLEIHKQLIQKGVRKAEVEALEDFLKRFGSDPTTPRKLKQPALLIDEDAEAILRRLRQSKKFPDLSTATLEGLRGKRDAGLVYYAAENGFAGIITCDNDYVANLRQLPLFPSDNDQPDIILVAQETTHLMAQRVIEASRDIIKMLGTRSDGPRLARLSAKGFHIET